MLAKDVSIIKASGISEPFSEKKLHRSLKRAHIPKNLEKQALEYIKGSLYQNISTQEIYRRLSEFLEKSNQPHTRAWFSLKHAIMQLGPGGFPFEKFIAALLRYHGYQTQTNLILKGKCVEHEVDVVASKEQKRFMLECKFHSQPGSRSDIKVALYTQARYEDLRRFSFKEKQLEFDGVWLITNTKTTSEVKKYARCVGMRIIGWNYPRSGNLQEFVERTNLHPITVLKSLSEDQLKSVLSSGIVLCKDLLKQKKDFFQALNINSRQRQEIFKEINSISQSQIK